VTRDELARPPPSVIKQTKQESTVSSATAGNFPFKKARLLLICGRTARTLFVDTGMISNLRVSPLQTLNSTVPRRGFEANHEGSQRKDDRIPL
jgi:hypothetical protein